MKKAFLLILWPILAQAQDASHPFSWVDCVALAAKKNPDLASAARSLESGKASYYGSFNGLMPQVTLSNGYSDSNSFNEKTGFHWQGQGTASLNLFDMGKIAGIRSASANVTQAQANLRLASAGLRFGLRQAFAQLLFAQKNVEVSKTILEIRKKSAELVSLRYSSGRESKGNMLRSKAQALQAQADLAQAGRSLKTAQAALNRELGVDDFSSIVAVGELATAASPELPADLSILAGQRPDVAVSQAAIRSAKAGVSQAKSSLWPNFSVNYSRSRLGAEEFPSRRYNWSVGGLLSYPLFGGGPTATYFAVSAAKKNTEKAEQDLRSVRNQAIVDLESTWSSFAGATEQVQVQSALLEAARQRSDEADVRYASGLLIYDNWEIIASDRISQERQALSAQLNAVNTEASWNKALGKTLSEE